MDVEKAEASVSMVVFTQKLNFTTNKEVMQKYLGANLGHLFSVAASFLFFLFKIWHCLWTLFAFHQQVFQ